MHRTNFFFFPAIKKDSVASFLEEERFLVSKFGRVLVFALLIQELCGLNFYLKDKKKEKLENFARRSIVFGFTHINEEYN